MDKAPSTNKIGGLIMNPPVCPYCGDIAPFGDERLIWISAHLDNRFHRLWWELRRSICRIRGHIYPEEWTHHNPEENFPIWWASKTCKRCKDTIWYRMVVW